MLTTAAAVILGGIPLMLFAIGYIGAMHAKSGGATTESIWLMLAGILLGAALFALALWRPRFVPAVFF
jgi:NhaP-type Na+/H+ or K+/H+ antiporter